MSWLDTLDVAIGITFMFLLLSLIAGALTEMLSWFLSWRANMLEDWVADLVRERQTQSDPATLWEKVKSALNIQQRVPASASPSSPPASALFDLPHKLYDHPLIDNLLIGLKPGKPSYMPADAFARALIDIVLNHGAGSPSGGGSPPLTTAEKLTHVLDGLPQDDPIRRWLQPMLQEAGGNIDKIRANIESYFDSAMERLSGWYKRKAYLGLLLFGTILTGALAVDTIEVSKYLFTNKTAREALVNSAEKFIGSAKAPDDLCAPATTTDTPAPAPGTAAAATKQVQDFKTRYSCLQDALSAQNYPIGWDALSRRFDNARKSEGKNGKPAPEHWYNSGSAWLVAGQTVLGFIFTVLAIAMGSNFWFDSLRNLMNLRAAGRRPQQSGASNGQNGNG